MPHSVVRDQLVTLASSTTGDPSGFLEGLGDIHVDWHTTIVRTYGFLLFHHRVVRYFQSNVNPALQNPVRAFTEQELGAVNVTPFGDNPDQADSLADLAVFSTRFESWHNPTHARIGAATGTPLTDARVNVFYRPFWQLHLYIDDLFNRALRAYANQAHPGELVSEDMIASHLESSHHGWVPRI